MHVKWRADRQIDRYAVGLKLKRLPMRNRETPSKKRDTEKMQTFESQPKRDLRWVSVRKTECRSPKARGNLEQEREQKRQQEMAAVAGRASVAALGVIRVQIEDPAEAPERQNGQKKPAAERVMEPRRQREAPDGSKGRWK